MCLAGALGVDGHEVTTRPTDVVGADRHVQLEDVFVVQVQALSELAQLHADESAVASVEATAYS